MTGHKRPRNRTKVMQPATNDRLPSREVIELARMAGLLDKVDLSEDYLIPAWAALEEIDKFAALFKQHLIAQGYRQCAKGQRTSQYCGPLEEALRALHHAQMALQGLTLELTGGYNHEPRTTALRPLVEEALAAETQARDYLNALNYYGDTP